MTPCGENNNDHGWTEIVLSQSDRALQKRLLDIEIAIIELRKAFADVLDIVRNITEVLGFQSKNL